MPQNPTTKTNCGEFSNPENPDLGAMTPPSILQNGEAPVVPTLYEVTYDPDVDDPDTDPKFTLV